MIDTRTASIPFSGFYESAHDRLIDDTIDQIFSDESGFPFPDLVWRATDAIDWRKVHLAYAQEYCSNLATACNATWQFAKLDSPREYNFRSDEIDVTITLSELQRMLDHVERATLAAMVKERCTSRDGFHSFYSPGLEDWGNLSDWEAPQLSILIECYCDEYESQESRDWGLMDDDNGTITAMLESAMPAETLQALYNDCESLRAVAA